MVRIYHELSEDLAHVSYRVCRDAAITRTGIALRTERNGRGDWTSAVRKEMERARSLGLGGEREQQR